MLFQICQVFFPHYGKVPSLEVWRVITRHTTWTTAGPADNGQKVLIMHKTW